VNDYTALAFMSELLAAGVKIPGDVSVVGLDNQLVARYCPVPLTSAVQPEDEIAQAVIELLTSRLEGNNEEPCTVIIRGGIVERRSVAAKVG
jgi:DNA-binding LacI/PurR family transcriptional regulator